MTSNAYSWTLSSALEAPMNTRFSVATHILTLLHLMQGTPVSSAHIAASVNTNPVLVRRLLSQLTRSGLTRSEKGSAGGAMLARDGATITLLQVHEAMSEGEEVIGLHGNTNPACPVGRNIEQLLRAEILKAETALRQSLAQTTVADLAGAIHRAEAGRPAAG